uniref:Neo-calmodulin-like n=1 Tax=Crassostrea virginica TaxID=6565 RepID=A0A8B8ECI9_CRAVI|nr:neo-calmodulin-like [Crassostrea virginica]XP_022337394.1 neo-calmodulin-like [Crassostrea virginica]
MERGAYGKTLEPRPRRAPVLYGEIAKRKAAKHQLTKEKVQELFDAFSMFDKNGDGMISADELKRVLFQMGKHPTLRELQAFVRSVDADKSGTIDFDEFLEIFARKMSIDPEKELHEVFEVFDGNKDGFISPDELFNTLSRLGEPTTKEEAQAMIREADLNGDGRVDYKEFKAILNFR